MEFRILGPLEVVDQGRTLPLGGARQRALLALLLMRANEVVSATIVGNPDLNVVYTVSGPEGQGAVAAVKAARKTGKIFVYSFDAVPLLQDALRDGTVPKGDALAVARIAGIAGAKRTPDLIPLCHPLAIHAVTVDLAVSDTGVEITAQVRTADRTGVEMEACPLLLDSAIGRGLDGAVRGALEIGPVSRALEGQPEELRQAAAASIREALTPFAKGNAVLLPASVWIVTARAS